MFRHQIQLTIIIVLLICISLVVQADFSNRIQPYDENPFHWQYKGEPVLLIGGTDDDNPFNQPKKLGPDGLASHLDLLQFVGGNYIRNTMSSRDAGSLWPFIKLENGKYDLEELNPKYWERFERLLKLAHERDIIVQLEIWDPWDYFADADEQGGWFHQPFNPINNVNYTLEESRLKNEIEYRTKHKPTGHNFFHTVPTLENNQTVLKYQKALVSKILKHSLPYPNVLYCLSNELGEPIEWSVYWAKFIHEQAQKHGFQVQVADMRRANDINSGDHKYLQDHPRLFTFLDISQNNGGSNWDHPEERHWDPIIEVRNYISDKPRPMNNTKIYGSGESSRGGEDQALQKFWRSVFAGCASARFHRPGAGPGLSQIAQIHIKSIRMLTENLLLYSCQPRNDLLRDRSANEAYCLAKPGKQYAVYFTDGGEVRLDLPASNKWVLRWLDVAKSRWGKEKRVKSSGSVSLNPPTNGHWIAFVFNAD